MCVSVGTFGDSKCGKYFDRYGNKHERMILTFKLLNLPKCRATYYL